MFAEDKKYRQVRDYCHCTGKYRGAAHCICNLTLNLSIEIPISFQSGSNYDYHFMIKELPSELEGQSEYFWENTEKYKNFSFPIEKEVKKIDKNGNGSVVTTSYKIIFIESERVIATSLSNLADNLAEGIHKIKCKDCNCFLEYESVKDNLIKYKVLSCNKDYLKKVDEKLKKRFKNTFTFSNNDINRFVLLLRKDVYPYEDMGDREKFNETTLREKTEFYNNLNMEDITDRRLHACKKSL